MGIGNRIKEARIHLGYTQEDLAKILGVTKGAVANYEVETSHPKESIMYKLFDALKVDANYLFQDEMSSNYPMKVTYTEMEHIKKYRSLDPHGKEMVDFTLLKEWERSTAEAKAAEKGLPMTVRKDTAYVNAAHANEGAIEEEKAAYKDIMDL